MAIVILCGLMTSTLLNMVVVPTMYLRYGRHGDRLKPDRVDSEPHDDACHSLAVPRQRGAVRLRHRVHRRRCARRAARPRRREAAAPPRSPPSPPSSSDGRHRRSRGNGRVRLRRHDRGRRPASTRSSRATDAEWAAVGASAAALVESANLLLDRQIVPSTRETGSRCRRAHGRCRHAGAQGDRGEGPRGMLAAGEAINASATPAMNGINGNECGQVSDRTPQTHNEA